ncbi:MAG: coproporphyrinogen III oxidase, partial [Pseudomonadota bacterium]
KTLTKVLNLHPDRLAVFGYAHVPWFKKHQKLLEDTTAPNNGLPTIAERLQQSEAARLAILAAGYVEVGFDHYARPEDPLAKAWTEGARQRNFQGYTADQSDVLLGLGASSISALPQGYTQHLTHLGDYRKAVQNGVLPIARGIAITAEDKLRRGIITEIMCEQVVNLTEHCRAAGISANHFDTLLPRLDQMAADGLILISDNCLRLTPIGRRLSRNVAAVFDQYLNPQTDKHAPAA